MDRILRGCGPGPCRRKEAKQQKTGRMTAEHGTPWTSIRCRQRRHQYNPVIVKSPLEVLSGKYSFFAPAETLHNISVMKVHRNSAGPNAHGMHVLLNQHCAF